MAESEKEDKQKNLTESTWKTKENDTRFDLY